MSRKVLRKAIQKAVVQAARKLTLMGIPSLPCDSYAVLSFKIKQAMPELEKNSAPDIFFSFCGTTAEFDKAKQQIQKLRAQRHKRRELKRQAKTGIQVVREDFYMTRAWRDLRYRVLRTYGPKCMCCGASGVMHVDHIKPRSKYPALELVFDNLQVLCEPCNMGKSNTDETDWRPKPKVLPFAVVKPSKAS